MRFGQAYLQSMERKRRNSLLARRSEIQEKERMDSLVRKNKELELNSSVVNLTKRKGEMNDQLRLRKSLKDSIML